MRIFNVVLKKEKYREKSVLRKSIVPMKATGKKALPPTPKQRAKLAKQAQKLANKRQKPKEAYNQRKKRKI